MGENEYVCASCRETFTKGRSDDEAQAEAHAAFGDIPEDEQEIVCDDCYKQMTEELPPDRFRAEALELAEMFRRHALGIDPPG
jgi:hypothetical protein